MYSAQSRLFGDGWEEGGEGMRLEKGRMESSRNFQVGGWSGGLCLRRRAKYCKQLSKSSSMVRGLRRRAGGAS